MDCLNHLAERNDTLIWSCQLFGWKSFFFFFRVRVSWPWTALIQQTTCELLLLVSEQLACGPKEEQVIDD